MKKILPFLFLLSAFPLWSQTVLENNAPRLKWYQVNTPHFRVLFPEGFDIEGQRMANTLEHIHEAEAKSMGSIPRKVSVVLQNQSSVSNGFVSMLPRRTEFYTMSPQDYNFLGTNDWLDMLASHEYRHLVQYQHATRGFNKFFYYLFGNATLVGFSQAAAPSWFWEGDAVATETAFTHSGRGRIPNFDLLFKTNLLEGRTFNYHKQYLRSYKHNIPNHYVLGYHMVSYLRRKTNDPDIWGKIAGRSWSVPFIPFAFSNAIKNKSDLYVTGLFKEMAQSVKKDWEEEIKQLQLTSFNKVNVRVAKAYTDYHYPQPQDDGSVLVMKSGIGEIEQFVLLKDGEEKKVFTPGFVNDAGMLSTAYNAVIWNEYGYHPRWLAKNYSLIKLYDFERKEKRVIGGRHTRYGSAALAPGGDKIVTVQSGTDYKNTLLILEIFTGKVLHEFPNPKNFFYSMPRWSDDGKNIVVLKNTQHGKTISLINPESGESKDILPVTRENVGHPVLNGDYLFFNSPASGIDNIHAVDLRDSKRYQVTSSKYGAYNPAISKDKKTIFYNDQSKDGLDVVSISFDTSTWKVFQKLENVKSYAQHLTDQEGWPHLFDSIPQQSLAIKKYSKLKGIIRPHSWGAFVDGDLSRVDVGITSQDILSTTSISAGYTFDLNERTGFWRTALSYQGLFPILDLAYTNGKRSVDEGNLTTLVIEDQDSTWVNNDVTFKWSEQNIETGFRIPLLTTRSKFASSVVVGNSVGFTSVSDFRNTVNNERYVPALIVNDTIKSIYPFYDYVGNGNLLYNHFQLSAYRLLKTSRRDIYSKWGQTAQINFYNTPYGGDLGGGLFSFFGNFYFPGLFKHHSLNGYVAYQHTMVGTDLSFNYDDYLFRNQVPVPRGLSVGRFKEFYSSSLNYSLPVWYPDIALGPILNIQRVRLNAFADYGFGAYRLYGGTSTTYVSVGGEIKFDINIFRLLPQLNIGFRYSYGIKPSVTRFDVLIGTFNF